MIEELEIKTGFDFFQTTDEKWYKESVNGYKTEKGSNKIIPSRKEWVPIFSISDIPVLDKVAENNYWGTIYAWESLMKPYLKNRGIEIDFDLVSGVIKRQVQYQLADLWNNSKQGRYSGWNGYGTPKNITLDKLSLEDLTTLVRFYVQRAKRRIEKWIMNKELNLDIAFDNVNDRYGNVWKWNSIVKQWNQFHGFAIKRPRATTSPYVIGPKYIATYDKYSGNTEPLACLMIERKYLPYYKAAIAVGDEIESKYCQLWVQKKFDHKDTPHKSIRPKYRKYIKKPLEECGVEIVEHDNLTSAIFATYQLPPLNTLDEYEEFLEMASKEVLEKVTFNY